MRVGRFSDEACETGNTLDIVCDKANLLVSFRSWVVVVGYDLCVPAWLQLLYYCNAVGNARFVKLEALWHSTLVKFGPRASPVDVVGVVTTVGK